MSEIIIYQTTDKTVQVEIQFEHETFWLTQQQIADLFGTQRPAITKHLGNIFKSGELDEKVVSSILEHTTQHGALKGKTQDVKVTLLSKSISNQLNLDIQKANEQYGQFEIKTFTLSHDRFLIIDSNEIYHLGASLKDLGKKWFAFSKLEKASVQSILNSIPELI
jgi:hypothetical protein